MRQFSMADMFANLAHFKSFARVCLGSKLICVDQPRRSARRPPVQTNVQTPLFPLIKLTREFIWEENRSPRIAFNYLYYLPEEGGLNLLDIRDNRNHVVERIPKPIAVETFMSEDSRHLHRRGSTTIL